MRRALFLLCLLVLMGCPPDVYAPSIPGGGNGAIEFKLDPITCNSSYPISFSADNTTLGAATLAPGGFSPAFPLSSGLHTIGARTTSGPAKLWPNENVSIAQDSKLTHILGC